MITRGECGDGGVGVLWSMCIGNANRETPREYSIGVYSKQCCGGGDPIKNRNESSATPSPSNLDTNTISLLALICVSVFQVVGF
jgi:hypothetical protein